MKCKEVRKLLTAYFLGDLDEKTSAAVRAHLESCDGCRAAAREIEPTLGLVRDALAATRQEAPERLSWAHRTRVLRPESQKERPDPAWIFRAHPRLAWAAGLVLMTGFVWLLVRTTLLQPARERASRREARMVYGVPSKSETGLTAGDAYVERFDDLKETPEAELESLDMTTTRAGAEYARNYLGFREGAVTEPLPIPASPAEEPVDTVGGEFDVAGLRGRDYFFDANGVVSGPGVSVRGEDTDADELGWGEGGRAAVRAPARAAPDVPLTGRQTIHALSGEKGGVAADEIGVVPADASFVAGGLQERRKAEEAKAAPPAAAPVPKLGETPLMGRLFEADRGARDHEDKPDEALAAGTEIARRRLWAAAKPAESAAARPVAREEEAEETVSEMRRLALVRRDLVPAADSEPATEAKFRAVGVNPFYAAAERPFSTFAIDVDTASYTLTRNYMAQGLLPPAEAVRTEEFVNSFDYAYKPPAQQTFKVYAEYAPSRFGRGLHLLKLGVKGRRLGREEQRRAVLTFLVDTSGSMSTPDRIDLVKASLRLLVEKLAPADLVAIVQYDSHARLVLAHTPVAEKDRILAAIDALQCSGSTNLEEGMHTAYSVAAGNFVSGGENRVLLLSDGVANLGSGAATDILEKVAAFRRQGIYCSVFGFGMGTYDDEMLETLANKGDGTYRFIDSADEARRVFVDDLAATLNTIAADVKIQVEFNPQRVKRYRQLGYENRQLDREDFRNDAVDAGEVGSGQSVTALYELELVAPEAAQHGIDGRLATVRVRYRRTDNGQVEEIECPVTDVDGADEFDEADVRFKLAACAAEFAEILRGSPFAVGGELEDVAAVLRPVALDLHLDAHVQELLRLVQAADGMPRAP